MEKNFLQRVSDVQVKLKAPKNQYNSFGKYKYRSCEDILEAAKPLCSENGLVLILSDKITSVGSRYYVEATAKLLDTESDASILSTASAREADQKKGMDESQITGTASSYARKYALNGLFNIDDTKDADTDEYKEMEREQKFYCSTCGGEIRPTKLNDGRIWPIEKMIAYSQKRYNGKRLCALCMKAEEKGRAEIGRQEADEN